MKKFLAVLLTLAMVLAIAVPCFADTPVTTGTITFKLRHGATVDRYDRWIKCSAEGVKITGVEFANESDTHIVSPKRAVGSLDYDVKVYVECEEGYTFEEDAKFNIVNTTDTKSEPKTEENYVIKGEDGKYYFNLGRLTCYGNIFEETLFCQLHILFYKWFGIE